MSTCDRQIGRRLLEGALSTDEESAAVSHLDHCPKCQAWLEQDAGDAALWSDARQLLESSGEVVRWALSGAPALETMPQLRRSGAEHDGDRAMPVDLSFLAPSDDPAYLGRVGAHEIVGLIGFGGMGVVLKAVDRSLNRFVAIKVLSPVLSNVGAARQRFAREARAMAALSHEHVVPIYAVDEHRGLPYFAMEYVPGGTLQARLSQQGPLEVIAAVRIAMQTALGLAAAHDSGLVHRDIKPANILLDRGVERVRVADFGLARAAAEASYTASGVLAGTPQFMSPEQVRGEACDGRSDLFSLGSMLYAMCTGHEPFRAESVYGVLQRIVHDEPRSIREQNPTVPAWLEGFIARLMAKDCSDRFQSAAEVAELLERELAYLQNPLGPAPARLWLRSTLSHPRWRRAALWGFMGAGTAALVAAVIGIWGPWGGAGAGEGAGGAQLQAAGAAAGGSASATSPTRTSSASSTSSAAAGGTASATIDGAPGSTPSADATAASAAPLQTVLPLWDDDGTAEMQQYVRWLELRERLPSDGPTSDPWDAAVVGVQRQLAALGAELGAPNAPAETKDAGNSESFSTPSDAENTDDSNVQP